MELEWKTVEAAKLTTNELYGLLELRSNVFIVEQNCPYNDIDGLDLHETAVHVLGYTNDAVGTVKLVACSRVFRTETVHIGRIVVAASHRGLGVGHDLMRRSLAVCDHSYPSEPVYISAQAHLEPFYGSLGFRQVENTSVYLEDGIPHMDMILDPPTRIS